MAEFLRSYGVFIIFGILLLLMVFRRGHGMGCGMGGHEHTRAPDSADGKKLEEKQEEKHSSGCH